MLKPDPITIRISFTKFTIALITFFITALGTLAYYLSPKPPAPNLNAAPTHTQLWHLTPNGNFEAEPTNWDKQLPDQLNYFTRSTTTCYDGLFSMKTNITAHHTGFANISEPLPVTPGKNYTLSAYFHTQHFPAGNLYLDLADTHNSFKLRARPSTAHWHFKYATFTAQAESIRIRLVCDGPIKSTYIGYIDCVALTPTEEFVP